MSKQRRAALYVRVSTDRQTVDNQIEALTKIAEQRGWIIVATYSDAGISGAKGRKDRPGLDELLKDASRAKFDILMTWALDRVGRSLIDLLDTLKRLETCGVDIFVEQQALDTSSATGRLMFQIVGAFSEFERGIIVERVKAG